ncbi:MAG TPA: hypothetical protein VGY66_23480 [Gemmataceae bacterium]|nr:hypothetical protein [Gemmataceae bacterium]
MPPWIRRGRCSYHGARRRPAYTLLEVLLASAIGVLLMGGLYVAVDVQLRHAQAGREVVQQGTLARALLARMTSDINASVGPVQPVVTGSSGSSGSGGGAGGAMSGGGGGASGGTNAGSASGASGASGSGAGSTANSTPAASSSAPAGTAAQINSFQGNNDALVVTVSKWPREMDLSPNASPDSEPTGVSDLRRITYWVAGGGGSPLGLARQEVKVVTSSDASLAPSIPPSVPDEASYVIAEEVKNLQFQYWDGTSWQDSWDSTQAGADGSTPQGPPLAIAITMDIALPGTGNGNGQDSHPKVKSYRHVVPILTANGATQASTTGTTTTP